MSDVDRNEDDLRSVIYYARFCCRIRIGVAIQVDDIRGGFDEVLASEPGGIALQRTRHVQFSDSRVFGEWFAQSHALTTHIQTLRFRTQGLASRLITTDEAMLFTGLDRATLYRWRREGRLTWHGRDRQPRWDVFELPQAPPMGAPAAPPPPRKNQGGTCS